MYILFWVRKIRWVFCIDCYIVTNISNSLKPNFKANISIKIRGWTVIRNHLNVSINLTKNALVNCAVNGWLWFDLQIYTWFTSHTHCSVQTIVQCRCGSVVLHTGHAFHFIDQKNRHSLKSMRPRSCYHVTYETGNVQQWILPLFNKYQPHFRYSSHFQWTSI